MFYNETNRKDMSKMYAYYVLARQNPVLTPEVRGKDGFAIDEKLTAINLICGLIPYYFDEFGHAKQEAVLWAAQHYLDEGTEITMPPLFPKEKRLPGSLRRHAQDAGGYGAYLLNKLANMILYTAKTAVPGDDAKKAEYWTLLFPDLWKRLNETFVTAEAAMAATNRCFEEGEIAFALPDDF